MRAGLNVVVIAVAISLSSNSHAALTAFAVPSTTSSSTWASIDSGWTGPLSIQNPADPFVTYSTVTTPTGLRWQVWGAVDTSVFPHVDHIALATRTLSTEMTQGETIRFGLDMKSGIFDIGNVGANNSMAVGLSINGGSTYSYFDNGSPSFQDTGVSTNTPIDAQITWTDTVANTYSGKITVIGSPTPAFTWSGEFMGLAGQNLSDPSNHLNGFLVSNEGSPTNYFGLRYIEVGSGALPDPATLVPEPGLLGLMPLVIVGVLTRARRSPQVDAVSRS